MQLFNVLHLNIDNTRVPYLNEELTREAAEKQIRLESPNHDEATIKVMVDGYMKHVGTYMKINDPQSVFIALVRHYYADGSVHVHEVEPKVEPKKKRKITITQEPVVPKETDEETL
jgi:hypothetical protein